MEMSEIWRVVLDQRWTVATLNNTIGSEYCYNTVEEDVVIEKIRTELKIEDTNRTNNVDPDKYLQETLETFSLFYCRVVGWESSTKTSSRMKAQDPW